MLLAYCFNGSGEKVRCLSDCRPSSYCCSRSSSSSLYFVVAMLKTVGANVIERLTMARYAVTIITVSSSSSKKRGERLLVIVVVVVIRWSSSRDGPNKKGRGTFFIVPIIMCGVNLASDPRHNRINHSEAAEGSRRGPVPSVFLVCGDWNEGKRRRTTARRNESKQSKQRKETTERKDLGVSF